LIEMGHQYSPLAKALHWTVALIVIGLIPVGLVMADLKPGPLQDRLFVLHESFGVTVLALMVLRAVRRWRGHPAPYPGLPHWERRLSTSVHHALYALLLLTPVLGWLALSAYGLGPSFFGVAELPRLLPKDEPLSKILFPIHEASALLIAGLATLHIAGALRHALLKRDDLIWRMLPQVFRRKSEGF
jgi:cytochrome b561